jgi:hypothetical protein
MQWRFINTKLLCSTSTRLTVQPKEALEHETINRRIRRNRHHQDDSGTVEEEPGKEAEDNTRHEPIQSSFTMVQLRGILRVHAGHRQRCRKQY